MRVESFSEIVQFCLHFKFTAVCLILSCAKTEYSFQHYYKAIYVAVYKFMQFGNRGIQIYFNRLFQNGTSV